MHWIEAALGTSDLYEILSCPRDANRGALRRAYYRAALVHHPDKNGDPQRFQAVSLAYRVLENPETRSEYDETGVIPGDEALDGDGDFGSGGNKAGVDQWKEYFDRIFGRVTTSKIDAFAQKYKCSEEEGRDVLSAFVKCRGNLAKMLDIVMLSEHRDADRWVSDYLRPAMEAGTLDRKYEAAMNKSLIVCQKKAAKQDEGEESEGDDAEDGDDNDDAQGMGDDDETESDDALDDEKEQKKQPQRKRGRPAQPAAASKKSPPPKKGGKTKSKPRMDDLVAAIQKKRGGGAASSVFASLGARYGVSLDDDSDPLGGDKFGKAQAKMLQKGKGSAAGRGRKK